MTWRVLNLKIVIYIKNGFMDLEVGFELVEWLGEHGLKSRNLDQMLIR